MRRTRSRQSATLGDDLYRRLRDDIRLGRLRPNEQLTEEGLAERLRVSRTPVRETLQRLASDGLIESIRRRWFVHEHTRAEVREIYEVRLALEGYAARLASVRASEEQIDQIVSLYRSRPLLGVRGDSTMVDFNDQFHSMIIGAAGNPQIMDIMERSRQFYFNMRLASLYDEADIAESQEQHRQLIEAIRERDGARAESMSREHIEHALRLVLERFF